MSSSAAKPLRAANAQPFNHLNGKLILQKDERFCRIAYGDGNGGWKLCDSNEQFKSWPTMREHITVTHVQKWGDEIVLADRETCASVASAGSAAVKLKLQPFIIPPSGDEVVAASPAAGPSSAGRRSSRASSAAAATADLTPAQAAAAYAAAVAEGIRAMPPGAVMVHFREVDMRLWAYTDDWAMPAEEFYELYVHI